MRVGAYARVSSDEQAERRSIDRQVEIIKRFVAEHPDFEVVDWYLDDGVSGVVALATRPEGSRLLNDLRDGRIEGVVITSLDRLGRSLLGIVDSFQKIEQGGGFLFVLDSPLGKIDTGNPVARFAFHLLAAVAELEREIIRDRTSSTRRIRAAEGLWTGGRDIPYGYRLVNRRLVVEPDEAAVIREMAYRRLAGWSFRKIAEDLNARGVRFRRKWANGKIELKEWTEGRVRDILVRRSLAGTRRYGDVLQHIEPILDEETDRLLKQGHTRIKDVTKGILSGIARCACGGRYYTKVVRHRRIGWERCYYRCERLDLDPHRPWRQQPCSGKLIPVEVVDTWILEEITNAIANPEHWWEAFLATKASNTEQENEIRSRMSALRARLEEEERAYRNLLDLYVRGRVPENVFNQADLDFRRVIREIETQLRQEQERLSAIIQDNERADEFARFLVEIRDAWATAPPEKRIEVARRFVRSAVIRTEDTGERHGRGTRKRSIVTVEFAFGQQVTVEIGPRFDTRKMVPSCRFHVSGMNGVLTIIGDTWVGVSDGIIEGVLGSLVPGTRKDVSQ